MKHSSNGSVKLIVFNDDERSRAVQNIKSDVRGENVTCRRGLTAGWARADVS